MQRPWGSFRQAAGVKVRSPETKPMPRARKRAVTLEFSLGRVLINHCGDRVAPTSGSVARPLEDLAKCHNRISLRCVIDFNMGVLAGEGGDPLISIDVIEGRGEAETRALLNIPRTNKVVVVQVVSRPRTHEQNAGCSPRSLRRLATMMPRPKMARAWPCLSRGNASRVAPACDAASYGCLGSTIELLGDRC